MQILPPQYSYQGTLNDQLYKADYEHVGDGDACESCDVNEVIHRPDRNTIAPFIYYGIIKSGNQVIKHVIQGIGLEKSMAD